VGEPKYTTPWIAKVINLDTPDDFGRDTVSVNGKTKYYQYHVEETFTPAQLEVFDNAVVETERPIPEGSELWADKALAERMNPGMRYVVKSDGRPYLVSIRPRFAVHLVRPVKETLVVPNIDPKASKAKGKGKKKEDVPLPEEHSGAHGGADEGKEAIV
jgi:hypothetical protein